MQRSFGERVAMNSPIQGTAADIIKIAMVRVSDRLKKEKCESSLILQIHDELLIEAKEDEVEKVKNILVEEMMQAAKLNVPLSVGVSVGKTWYEAK
jgi:DNA polymerase-1